MTWITWLSNTGGLMGLCMGMSFVSIAEIIYYCARVGTLLNYNSSTTGQFCNCSICGQSLKSIFIQWSRYIGSSTWSSNILFSDDGTSLRAWTRKPWSWGGGHGSAAVSKGASFLSFKLFHAPCLPWWLLLPRWFHFFEGYGREEYDCMQRILSQTLDFHFDLNIMAWKFYFS